ncbi:hypothetical protein [Allorhizocola rhizosphaerae]|uniref:hypothetical protein n=1 Tax=Allorhizocola rhizosphaerae TaxID=1872709 RepID=UPI0013C32249|nr:hypothetical protein [Allorhizocola rhizosphaerae]
MSSKDAATLKLEAIRTALTVAAGIGAAATLLLAFRRQSTTEQAQHFTERDAQEQRITELYVAAAAQLGSDKAAVRLAGLYALERVGQNNPHMRQTVVDVICAYLRMPYTPPRHITQPGPAPKRTRIRTTPAQRADILRQRTEQQQEFQVRQTAQRLLATHTHLRNLNQEPETFWRTPQRQPMDLDLARANLTDFNLSHCHVGNLDLNHANLHETV